MWQHDMGSGRVVLPSGTVGRRRRRGVASQCIQVDHHVRIGGDCELFYDGAGHSGPMCGLWWHVSFTAPNKHRSGGAGEYWREWARSGGLSWVGGSGEAARHDMDSHAGSGSGGQ